jgi:hypothetical protein
VSYVLDPITHIVGSIGPLALTDSISLVIFYFSCVVTFVDVGVGLVPIRVHASWFDRRVTLGSQIIVRTVWVTHRKIHDRLSLQVKVSHHLLLVSIRVHLVGLE